MFTFDVFGELGILPVSNVLFLCDDSFIAPFDGTSVDNTAIGSRFSFVIDQLFKCCRLQEKREGKEEKI